MANDPGDEDDGPPRIRFLFGKTQCFYPRRWFVELVSAPPEHDPGDEEPRWQPLCDISRKRLERELGL
jgi:hypothetical protein